MRRHPARRRAATQGKEGPSSGRQGLVKVQDLRPLFTGPGNQAVVGVKKDEPVHDEKREGYSAI